MTVKRMNKVLALVAAGVLVCGVLALVGCGSSSASSSAAASSSASSSSSLTASSSSKASSSSASSSYTTSVKANDPYGSGIHHAVVTVEGYDPFTITMDADEAPVSVSNFCELANEGYYDGLTFYRFVDGFCMQGGTKGNNASGSDASLTPIVGEFSGNGVDNALADDFKKGVVAMARSSNPNSATSTFFVTLGSGASVAQSLNGLYAAFGSIDDAGMAVVDQIVADYLPNVTDSSMGAIADTANQAVISSITITD